jgi:pimeloyl-ACP methyl ester carboxylesterase
VATPTLVLHCTKDGAVPFECGREFAAGIKGARFVPLESSNHILLQHEPAFSELLGEIRSFING